MVIKYNYDDLIFFPDAVLGVVLPFESEVSPGVRPDKRRTGDETIL